MKNLTSTLKNSTKLIGRLGGFALLFGRLGTPCSGLDATKPASLFGDKELNLEMAGQWSANEPRGIGKVFETNARHGSAGLSFGTLYFAKANFGLGFETAIGNLARTGPLLISSTTITLAARLPFELRGLGASPMALAPSVIAGLGRNFSDGLYNTQVGVGLEWRRTGRVSLFAEARFIFQVRRSEDRLIARSGLRFNF
jgi:hypothetical protein